jgi:hypothetical protein
MERFALLHRTIEMLNRNELRRASNLDVGGVGRPIVPEQNSCAAHPVTADEADFSFLAAWENGDDGGDA